MPTTTSSCHFSPNDGARYTACHKCRKWMLQNSSMQWYQMKRRCIFIAIWTWYSDKYKMIMIISHNGNYPLRTWCQIQVDFTLYHGTVMDFTWTLLHIPTGFLYLYWQCWSNVLTLETLDISLHSHTWVGHDFTRHLVKHSWNHTTCAMIR